MEDLRVSIIQSDLKWQDKIGNLEMFTQKISTISQADLIVLPEMFTTGFTMNTASLAENLEGETVSWMRKMASTKNAVISGSIIIEDGSKYYNRLIWMRPEGSYEYYDKRHLFRMAEEDAYFNSGINDLTVELKGWKIRPLICYDLRFPIWSRNRFTKEGDTLKADYDLLIYTANWPKVRINAWDILLQARAVENQAYCIGLNRIGMDGNQKQYIGHSAIVDPKGEYLIEPHLNDETILQTELSWKYLADYREKFPQGLDADAFSLSK